MVMGDGEARARTCVVLDALTGEAALSAAAHAVGAAGLRVAQVDLRLTVVSCEAGGTAAAQPANGVDGSEQDGVRGYKRRQAVKLEDGHTLHVVLTRLTQADVVIEGKNLLRGDLSEKTAIQVEPLLELLGAEELRTPTVQTSPVPVPTVSERCRPLLTLSQNRDGHRQADVEDASTDISVVLDVEDDDIFRRGGEDAGHAIQELGEQQGQEVFLRRVGEPQRDAVGQHFICDDGDLKEALGRHCMDTVCKRERNQ